MSVPGGVAVGDGETLVVSDYENRDKYLQFTCQHRSPTLPLIGVSIAAVGPLHSDREAVIRYRQIEYHRMPLLPI